MRETLKELRPELIDFICSECGLSKDELFAMDDDQLYDKVYDPMCDIEMAEIPLDNSPETEHCKKASEIVTILGNTLAEDDDED